MFTWLHVSDLHIGLDDRGSDRGENLQRFLNDVDDVVREIGTAVDVIFFTGDLTQRGTEEEFSKLEEELLEPLLERLADPVLLAVPGNHDLQWAESKKDKRWAEDLLRDPDSNEVWQVDGEGAQFIHARFAAYQRWWDRRRPKSSDFQAGLFPGDFLYVHTHHSGRKFGVAGLNSACLHLNGDVKPAMLKVSKHQLTPACPSQQLSRWLSSNDFSFLLTHHPPGWLDEQNRISDFDDGLQARRFDLHLYGHMHEPVAQGLRKGGGVERRALQAASMFGIETIWTRDETGERQAQKDRRFGYAAGRVELEGSQFNLRMLPRRAYRAQQGGWRFGSDRSYEFTGDLLSCDPFEPWPARAPGELPPTLAPPTLRETSAELDWPTAVVEHPFWDRVDDGAKLRERSCSLASVCLKTWRESIQAADDPWADEQLIIRALHQLGVLARDARLSAAQVEVLLLAPLIHETMWASAVAWLVENANAMDLEAQAAAKEPRFTLQTVHQAHSRVHRLARRLEGEPRRVACYWLIQQAVHRYPELWSVASPTDAARRLRSVVSEAFGPATSCLFDVARCFRGGLLHVYGEGGLRDQIDVVLGGAPADLARLGALVAAAGATALDLRVIDPVAIDHISSDSEFSPNVLRAAARRSIWIERSDAFVLNLACVDPVEHFCMIDLVRRADSLLDALRDQDPDVSSALTRKRLSEAQVLPKTAADGRRQFEPMHARFRLDHVRVRELLMGERLYGDPTLAVRELYQNALDACRYRQVRGIYRERTERLVSDDYRPLIVLRQGMAENGRVFIECEDNGVGMSAMVLEHVFAVAGRRFQDQNFFLEERAKWRTQGLSFNANSQHGIGVLSYFMLADEIEVRTRAYQPNGEPGRPLLVYISSAHGLFRVNSGSADMPTGSRIRLWLTRDAQEQRLSAAEALGEQLVIAEFPVEVWEDVNLAQSNDVMPGSGDLRSRWEPGIPRLPSRWDVDIEPASESAEVWWASGVCPVLADGLMTSNTFEYALINCAGEHYPQLSADRREILNGELDWAREVLRATTAKIARLPKLSYMTLLKIFDRHPWIERGGWASLLATNPHVLFPNESRLMARALSGRGLTRVESVSLRTVGLCAVDLMLSQRDAAIDRWRLSCMEDESLALICNPRLVEHEPCTPTLGQALVPMMGVDDDGAPRIPSSWEWQGRWPTPDDEAYVAQQWRRHLQWMENCLGICSAIEPISLPEYLERIDLCLLNALKPGAMVKWPFVLGAAADLGQEPGEIVKRLEQLRDLFGLSLSWPVSHVARYSTSLDREDWLILSEDFDAQEPWLEEEIPVLRLLDVMIEFGLTEVQARRKIRRVAEIAGLRWVEPLSPVSIVEPLTIMAVQEANIYFELTGPQCLVVASLLTASFSETAMALVRLAGELDLPVRFDVSAVEALDLSGEQVDLLKNASFAGMTYTVSDPALRDACRVLGITLEQPRVFSKPTLDRAIFSNFPVTPVRLIEIAYHTGQSLAKVVSVARGFSKDDGVNLDFDLAVAAKVAPPESVRAHSPVPIRLLRPEVCMPDVWRWCASISLDREDPFMGRDAAVAVDRLCEILEDSAPASLESSVGSAAVRWHLQACRYAKMGVHPMARAVVCAGRMWAWWLTDEQLIEAGRMLEPLVERAFEVGEAERGKVVLMCFRPEDDEDEAD